MDLGFKITNKKMQLNYTNGKQKTANGHSEIRTKSMQNLPKEDSSLPEIHRKEKKRNEKETKNPRRSVRYLDGTDARIAD